MLTVQQVHVCKKCAELPPKAPTLGVAAMYLVDMFPPLARSISTSNHLSALLIAKIALIAEEQPPKITRTSMEFARTWHLVQPVSCPKVGACGASFVRPFVFGPIWFDAMHI